MIPIRSLIAAVALLTVVPLAAGPRRGAAPSFGARVATLAAASVDAPAPGVLVGVMRNGRVLHDHGYGLESVADAVPAWSGSVFQIGSITKQMAAAGILKLQEQGLVSLDDDVRTFIPELDTRGHVVTVRHLLNHTSGIPEFLMRISNPWAPVTASQVISLTNSMPWVSPPGERFAYNNTGYWMAGLIIERAAERPWSEYLRDSLFLPAGMTTTGVCGEPPVSEVPSGYIQSGRLGEVSEARPVDMTIAGAAGSVCSTTGDLLRWNEALWNGVLLSPDSLQAMTTPAQLSGDRIYGYGLGVGLLSRGGRTVIAHSGSVLGFQSDLLYDPRDRFSAVVLMNITVSGPPPATELSDRIYAEWRSRPRTSTLGGDAETSVTPFGSPALLPAVVR